MITSTSNPRVKQIRSLRQRKHREESGTLFVDGLRAFESLDLGRDVEALIAAPEIVPIEGQTLLRQAREKGVRIEEVSSRVFATLTPRETPDGIGAVVRQRWSRLEDASPGPEDCWVALHSMRDPRNIGAVIRVADAVGVAGIVLLDDSVDPYSPEAVRSSTGAVFAQTLVRTDFRSFDAWRKKHGATCVATAADAAMDYAEVLYPSPLVLLMGSERQGLSVEQTAAADVTVRIPMTGHVTSLNVAVATAVVLYEIFHQRQGRAPRK